MIFLHHGQKSGFRFNESKHDYGIVAGPELINESQLTKRYAIGGITGRAGVMHTPNGSAAVVHLTSQASSDSCSGYLLLVHGIATLSNFSA